MVWPAVGEHLAGQARRIGLVGQGSQARRIGLVGQDGQAARIRLRCRIGGPGRRLTGASARR